jgi:hypothetical protein
LQMQTLLMNPLETVLCSSRHVFYYYTSSYQSPQKTGIV